MIRKGIVVASYQGMGKTTLTTSNKRYFDLESSDYPKDNPDWYKQYVADAIAKVSSDDYDVCFVSSHDIVLQELIRSDHPFLIFYPGVAKEIMEERLARRYFSDKTIKNANALANCVLDFVYNTTNLSKYTNSISTADGFINDEVLRLFTSVTYDSKKNMIQLISKKKADIMMNNDENFKENENGKMVTK